MAHEATSNEASTQTASDHEHHSGPASHSPTPDKSIPTDDCQSLSSCSSVVFAPDVVERLVDPFHASRVMQVSAPAPASESLDLEPPPPKA